jgi:thiol-disulfide isomerase/thioredoxin
MLSIFISLFISISAQARTCDDTGKIYKVCSDQIVNVYNPNLAQALANDQLLLISFGADWCGWCKSLHRIFHDNQFWGQLDNKLVLTEIGTTFYDSGEQAPSGVELLNQLFETSLQDKSIMTGIPFLAVVNPKTNQIAFIQTGGLEDNSHGSGHDPAKVLQALQDAIASVSK